MSIPYKFIRFLSTITDSSWRSRSDTGARVPTSDEGSTAGEDDVDDDMFAEDDPSGEEDEGSLTPSRGPRARPETEDLPELDGLDDGLANGSLADGRDGLTGPIGGRDPASWTPPPVAGPSGCVDRDTLRLPDSSLPLGELDLYHM